MRYSTLSAEGSCADLRSSAPAAVACLADALLTLVELPNGLFSTSAMLPGCRAKGDSRRRGLEERKRQRFFLSWFVLLFSAEEGREGEASSVRGWMEPGRQAAGARIDPPTPKIKRLDTMCPFLGDGRNFTAVFRPSLSSRFPRCSTPRSPPTEVCFVNWLTKK